MSAAKHTLEQRALGDAIRFAEYIEERSQELIDDEASPGEMISALEAFTRDATRFLVNARAAIAKARGES